MQPKMSLATLLGIAVLLFSQAGASASECDTALSAHLKTDLSLTVKEFDQSQAAGWRLLEQKRCFDEAASLINKYEEEKNIRPPFLEWHRAQLLAMGGKYQEARAIALTTIRPEPGIYPSGFRWNDYVLAVIAFLDADRVSFDNHADQVRRSLDNTFDMAGELNAMNSRVLDRLGKCFTRTYTDALDCE